MKLSGRQIFEKLLLIMNEDEIFRKCDFSKERFLKNLEKEDKGEIDQLVLKQYYLLLEILPINFWKQETQNQLEL